MRSLTVALGLLAATACGPKQVSLKNQTSLTEEPGRPPGERPKQSYESGVTVGDATKVDSSGPWHAVAPSLPGQPATSCLAFRTTPDNKAACDAHCREAQGQGRSPCTCSEGVCPRPDNP